MTKYLSHALDPCFMRVNRANERIAELERHICEIARKQADACTIEFDPNPPHKITKTIAPAETFFGMDVPILIGEICYHFRSALDYLVFELAKLDSGVEQKGTQFPIEDDPNRFRGNAPRMLAGINPVHVAAIERLQPYNRCDWIERLRDCSNPDKHRHFVEAGGVSRMTAHSSLERDDLDRIDGFERDAPFGLGHVKVKVHNALTITFEDGFPVIETLQEIQSCIAHALRYFKPEFK